jgi:hypothetical protein
MARPAGEPGEGIAAAGVAAADWAVAWIGSLAPFLRLPFAAPPRAWQAARAGGSSPVCGPCCRRRYLIGGYAHVRHQRSQ